MLPRWHDAALVLLVLGVAASACDSARPSHGPPEPKPSGGGTTDGLGGTGGHVTEPSTGGSIIMPPVPHCGDGKADPDEACDDGNRIDGDGCSSLCSVETGSHCPAAGQCNLGDGRLEVHEECDDGNTVAGDGCTPDGKLEFGWVCPLPGKPCRVRCGDRVTTPPETCDDGNTTSGDGCARNCQLEPLCGAPSDGAAGGAAGAGGESNAGNESSAGGESGASSAGTGGKATVGAAGAAGESNGNAGGAGGESSACVPAVCGDGIVAGDEQCDDGAQNLGVYGGCLSTCTYATYCGDGVVDAGAGEQCDDGHNVTLYGQVGCGPGCRLPHFCGDGYVDASDGEQCDPGTSQSSSCSRTCLLRI